MHQIIFIPGEPERLEAAERLAEVGLIDHRERSFAIPAPPGLLPEELRLDDNPDEPPGVVCFWVDSNWSIPPSARHGFCWLSAVEWGQFPADRYYIGFDPDAKPTPIELLRMDPIQGEPILLGDGNRWIIPTPKTTGHILFARDGAMGMAVPPRLAEFWHRVMTFSEDLSERKGVYDVSEAFNLALSALNVNYRLPREMLGTLELLTSSSTGTLARMVSALTQQTATMTSPSSN